MIERYIYTVTQKLPEPQRADISKELSGLIQDMLDDRIRGGAASADDVEQVLMELGDPSKLADRYRGTKRFLIGPELFPSYLTVLKIVFAAIGIAMAGVFVLQTIFNPVNLLDHFVDCLVAFISGCFQGFAWVTVIFGVIEYRGLRSETTRFNEAKPWKPSDLPPLPDHRNRVKRSDPITSILFQLLIVIVFTFSLESVGVWRLQDGASVVPFFNEDVFRRFLPYIWLITGLSICKDCLLLIKGKWTFPLIGFDMAIACLHFALAFVMLQNAVIWNPDFMQQMTQAGLTSGSGEAYETVSAIWSWTAESLIYMIGLVTVIQLIASIVKAFRIKGTA